MMSMLRGQSVVDTCASVLMVGWVPSLSPQLSMAGENMSRMESPAQQAAQKGPRCTRCSDVMCPSILQEAQHTDGLRRHAYLWQGHKEGPQVGIQVASS